jgi:sugar O-acyltransferase (sialic acid O-acetyltransferase NeuD family)
MKMLVIFGTSGFARETRDIAAELGWRCSFVAAREEERDAWAGQEDVLLESELDAQAGCPAAIGIGDNEVRRRIATRFGSRYDFINLVHPSASFGNGQLERIEKRQGVIVCAGARFTNGIEVGDFSIFNLNCTIGHDVIIGDFVNVSPGANVSGYVQIGDACWIGTNAAINQGSANSRRVIGSGTMVGAGSVVVRDCEPNSTYVGIPARKR